MKKIFMFLIIVLFIICSISYLYLNYKANYNIARRTNMEYQKYLNQEIDGTEVATIINKVINSNEKNYIQKDKKNSYIENNEDSIKAEIKMLDTDSIYTFEQIYNKGIENFMSFYREIKFKCTNIQYHKSTNKVKYMLFEQITV